MPQFQLWDLPGSGADSFVEGFSVNRPAQGGLRRSRYDRNREVKLAVYADDLHTKPAEVACTTNGVSVSGNEITVSGDSSNLPLWSALLLASTLTLAGAVHYKRKRAR